ncbi:MAG TPA: hypothetical protein VJB11_00495 [archaeon]|nr:hypothetical protein [archaeon]
MSDAFDDMKKDINEWKNNYLSPFCLDECSEKCCNKWIMVEHKDIHNFSDNVINPTEARNGTPIYNTSPDSSDSKYVMIGICPNYDDGKCAIHESPFRADVCKEYPVDIMGDSILVRSSCSIKYCDAEEMPLKELTEIGKKYNKNVDVGGRRIFSANHN